MNEFKAVLAALGGLKAVSDVIGNISQQLEAVSKIVTTKEHEEVPKKSSAPYRQERRENYETSLRLRHHGTGAWLIESDGFQQWASQKNSASWLYGIPGTGETILSAVVLEHIVRMTILPGSEIALVYFYYDYKNPLTNAPANLLACLIKQLARQDQSSFDLASEYYYRRVASGGWISPPVESLQELFFTICSPFEGVIIVVDGTDECGDNQKEVTEVLCDLREHLASIKVVIFSRDDYAIRRRLDDYGKLSIAARNCDLCLYVAAEIEKRVRKGELRMRDPNLRADMMDALINGAHGMLRWVTCQMDYLCKLPADASRRKALKTLPPTLSETY